MGEAVSRRCGVCAARQVSKLPTFDDSKFLEEIVLGSMVHAAER